MQKQAAINIEDLVFLLQLIQLYQPMLILPSFFEQLAEEQIILCLPYDLIIML